MYFSEKIVADLVEKYSKIHENYMSLLSSFAFKKFSNAEADELAKHGFMRRLKTLNRCTDNIYKICPPQNDKRLTDHELSDLTINLQSFIFNVFGILDNLAGLWVKEKGIKVNNGKPIRAHQIGFGEKYKLARNSFPESVKNYLEGKNRDWYEHLENFRHALAHRIPLYVPPYVLNDEEAKLERELEAMRIEALKKHNFEEYEQITERLKSLGKFIPWMTHSFREESKQVIFHAQVIADWNTIISISELFLKEM